MDARAPVKGCEKLLTNSKVWLRALYSKSVDKSVDNPVDRRA